MSSSSYIVHRSPDGERLLAILSLSILKTLDHHKIESLKKIGIYTVSDLLHYAPIHRARLILAVAHGHVAHDMDLRILLRDSALPNDPTMLVNASTEIVDGIAEPTAGILAQEFNVGTIADLAEFPAYLEAESLLCHEEEPFSEPASAPDELIPRATGAVASIVRYNSMIIDKTFQFQNVSIEGDRRSLDYDATLSRVFESASGFVRLPVGYIALQTQKWINMGTHLGEVMKSVGLAPGESRNIAVIDWRRSHLFQRSEDNKIAEELTNVMLHSRALDDVAQAVAQEHQWGRTRALAATAVAGLGVVGAGALGGATAGAAIGSFTGAAAGGLVGAGAGGVGGAVLGGSVSFGTLSVPAAVVLAIVGGLGGSLAVGTLGAVAGTVAGAVIGGTAGGVGYIQSETHGDRTILGHDRQDIMDVTSQKATLARSLRSTIIIEDYQAEAATAQTLNLTNYNHSHSLNLTFYEILNRYMVELRTERLEPFVILPIKPVAFDRNSIAAYWDILRWGITDKALVEGFDRLVGARGTLDLPSVPVVDPTQAQVISMQFEFVRPIGSDHPGDNPDAPGWHTIWLEDSHGAGGPMHWRSDHTDLHGKAYDQIWTGDFTMALSEVSAVHVELPSRTTPRPADWRYTLKLIEAKITVPGSSEPLTVTDVDLEPLDDNVAHFGTRDQVHFKFKCRPMDNILGERSQHDAAEAQDIIDHVIGYINRRRYLFTRLLLAGLEAEQVVNIIANLNIVVNGHPQPLTDFMDPMPIGYSGYGILFQLKHAEVVPDKIAEFGRYVDELQKWFADVGDGLTTREIYLPSSGLFCEAILGRSNASEKIELTRFWNWQDSPISNQAPSIQAVDTGSRAEPTPNVSPTLPANVVNIAQPTPLPDATGLAGILSAIQNPNIFRDMSKADLLTGVMNNLSDVAEKVATKAGDLSEEAASKALQSAVDLGKSVAELTGKLFDAQQKADQASTKTTSGGNNSETPKVKDTEIVAKNPTVAGGLLNEQEKQRHNIDTEPKDASTSPNKTVATSSSKRQLRFYFYTGTGELLNGNYTAYVLDEATGIEYEKPSDLSYTYYMNMEIPRTVQRVAIEIRGEATWKFNSADISTLDFTPTEWTVGVHGLEPGMNLENINSFKVIAPTKSYDFEITYEEDAQTETATSTGEHQINVKAQGPIKVVELEGAYQYTSGHTTDTHTDGDKVITVKKYTCQMLDLQQGLKITKLP